MSEVQKPDQSAYWDAIYQSKTTENRSWYEANPLNSRSLLKECALSKDAHIIDIGGGDSLLVDQLLHSGFTEVTVLDISAAAIERAKQRLGPALAKRANWIVADIATFYPTEQYDCWHDRAAFHFLTEDWAVEHYVNMVAQHIKPGGHLVLGTFSENGPNSCSGLPIRQYSESKMNALFQTYFEKQHCITTDHHTPTQMVQNFLFCRFKYQPIALIEAGSDN